MYTCLYVFLIQRTLTYTHKHTHAHTHTHTHAHTHTHKQEEEEGEEEGQEESLCRCLAAGDCDGSEGEVGGWGRDPKKCTGRDWGMGLSTI